MPDIPREAIDAGMAVRRCGCLPAYHDYDCTRQFDPADVEAILEAAAPVLAGAVAAKIQAHMDEHFPPDSAARRAVRRHMAIAVQVAAVQVEREPVRGRTRQTPVGSSADGLPVCGKPLGGVTGLDGERFPVACALPPDHTGQCLGSAAWGE